MRGAKGVGSHPAHQLVIFDDHSRVKAAAVDGEILMPAKTFEHHRLPVKQQLGSVHRNGADAHRKV